VLSPVSTASQIIRVSCFNIPEFISTYGNKLYYRVAPEGTAFPYIIYDLLLGADDFIMYNNIEQKMTWRIYGVYRNGNNMEDINNILYRVLRQYPLIVPVAISNLVVYQHHYITNNISDVYFVENNPTYRDGYEFELMFKIKDIN
jgi:hypothetical protein